MTDYFALLNEPRRPWLDPEVLKSRFQNLSAIQHPDRVHQLSEAKRGAAQARFIEINAAYNCLRNPKERLRHLILLETGKTPADIKQIPAELLADFMMVGNLCRETDLLLVEKEKHTSPLLKVQWFQKSQDKTDQLQQLQQYLTEERDSLMEKLRQIDSRWPSEDLSGSRAQTLHELEAILHLFGFYDRWIAQVHERIAKLGF